MNKKFGEADPDAETTLETWASLDDDGGLTESAYSLTDAVRAGEKRVSKPLKSQ